MSESWVVYRYGEPVSPELSNFDEAWRWASLRHPSRSIEYAVSHGGYELRKVSRQCDGENTD
jgi:hypothetical protein